MGLDVSEGGQRGRRGPHLRNGPLRDSWPPSQRILVRFAQAKDLAEIDDPTHRIDCVLISPKKRQHEQKVWTPNIPP